jgi:hypothetical protein
MTDNTTQYGFDDETDTLLMRVRQETDKKYIAERLDEGEWQVYWPKNGRSYPYNNATYAKAAAWYAYKRKLRWTTEPPEEEKQ